MSQAQEELSTKKARLFNHKDLTRMLINITDTATLARKLMMIETNGMSSTLKNTMTLNSRRETITQIGVSRLKLISISFH